MCGIIGYIGRNQATPILLQGLKRLEYRGYDSSGIAVIDATGAASIHKAPGKLDTLIKSLNGEFPKGTVGLGHTRWATHGSPKKANAHPQVDCNGDVIVVHNGIVENYLNLKTRLQGEGHTFTSETDTEVIAHLIESYMLNGESFDQSVSNTATLIKGAQAAIAMHTSHPDKLIAFRLGNAGGLAIGYGPNETYLASDLPALVPHTSQVTYIDPGEMAIIQSNQVQHKNLDGEIIEKVIQKAPYDEIAVAKGGFKHFMLKEIMEQPHALFQTLAGKLSLDPPEVNLGDLPFSDSEISRFDRVVLTGMGTSLLAAQVGRHYIETLAGLPTEVENSSEMRYRDPVLNKDTLVISVSQSGETADTLAAIEQANQKKCKQITVCNVQDSQATRMVDATVHLGVGPELGVASTKTFTGSLVALFLIATHLGKRRGMIDSELIGELLQDLSSIPRLVGQALQSENEIIKLAQTLFQYENVMYLGRGINMPVALEGALKLKEVSYIHAEGFPAGEMKHGPIALIDREMPIVVVAPNDGLYGKMEGNVQEVKARGGKVIAIMTEGNTNLKAIADECIEIPEVTYLLSPIISVVPLQLLAYHIAILRGCDVDQPRNLAKTVTVE